MRTALPALFFAGLSALALGACGDSQKADPRDKFMTASCKTDDTCAEGFICKDGTCAKGERSKADLAKKAAEEAAEVAKKAAEKTATKPGDTRLEVRICPVFKNTPEATGTIKAKHVESGEEHLIHMALAVKEGGWQDVFTYYSVKPGKYEVTASYGINTRGHIETVLLKCHDKIIKNKKLCKDGVIRLVDAVPLDQIPPRETKKDEKTGEMEEVKIECDWIVE